ncbi:MAG: hypothetical protein PG981_000500 [Wolbachia endosymbiont of Ctenocephalides orientis wCori]|nr:MAG: hypothetical protein PG981_000500 [Wolbachia endosymbiont of Ctenocephalides orientis wCori]
MSEIDFCQSSSLEDYNNTGIATRCFDDGIFTIEDAFNQHTGACAANITMRDENDVIFTLFINGHLDEASVNEEGKLTAKYIIEAKVEGDIEKIISFQGYDMEHLPRKSA